MKRPQISGASLVFLALAVLSIGRPPAWAQASERRAPGGGEPTGLAADSGQPLNPEVFFCPIKNPRCRTGADTFVVQDLRDLYVFVTWPGLSGKHTQAVEFILPDGHLYERKETVFVLERQGSGRGPRRRPGTSLATRSPAGGEEKGAAAATPQPFLTTSRGVRTVVTVLPVAGTFITQHGLSGTWTIRVFLDGELAQLSQFTLTFDPAP